MNRMDRSLSWPLFAAFFLLLLPCAARPQATTAAGSVQGTITDSTGAVVAGATVTISSIETAVSRTFHTDSAGYYNSGPLVPGHYTLTVAASGFESVRSSAVVQIGTITNGNFSVRVGQASTVIEVQSNDVRVDTEQDQVQGVLTAQQIDNLPINGRNFLDLAQLEPGVQLQDGQDFDPTKAGYSSVSFNGIFGRTARIMLDGQDISDETVGTTTLNVTQGSIEEVQINRSMLDLSNEITSSGSVVVSTRSGSNGFHGDTFYNFRDERAGFAAGPGGTTYPFQRNQFGGRFGGPILKDRLFFFTSAERIKQDAFNPVVIGGSLAPTSGGYNGKFNDTYSSGRLDYNAPHGIHLFFRAAYEVNYLAATYGYGYSVYGNRDNTPALAYGADWVTGKFTHSLRSSYLKFHNMIVDDSASAYNPVPGVQLSGPGGFYSGPNLLAPQQTFQSDKQFRYDGGWDRGAHQLRYGISLNRILGGGLADFFGLAPEVTLNSTPPASGAGDPGNYTTSYVIFGNGEGFFTEKPGFGFPAGGQGDWRLGLYVGDAWKLRPNLTLNYGLRYSRDTGRTDSDLAPIPCSAVNAGLASPCTSTTGNLLDSLLPGLAAPVRQPNSDMGPQFGFAWDPRGKGQMVVRGGIGLYWENNIFNNTLFDRPDKLASGLFNGENFLCGQYGTSFPMPNGTTLTSIDGIPFSTLCSEPISQAAPEFAKLQAQYQSATAQAGAAANPSFLGNTLTDNNGDAIYGPNYRVPRSIQMNIGIQRQLWAGGVVTADYVRNVGEHFAQNIDVNHVGDARYFNMAAAQNAVASTLTACGAATIDAAIASCPNAVAGGPGATIADFAANGLDSGNAYLANGYPASALGLTPSTGAAFPGMNPLWGKMLVGYPIGRSVYNGLQLNFRQAKANPFKGIRNSNFEASYTFSRFVSTGGADQFFTPGTFDYNHPTKYIGPSGLDRTHMLSFGGYFDVIGGAELGLTGHFFSSLPTNLILQTNPAGLGGEIFRTDVTGDGTTGDLVPGTEPGAFMRQYKGSGVNKLISQWNGSGANQLTPAGNTLVNSGLFTSAQLQELQATTQPISAAPANQSDNGILRTFDGKLSYPIKLHFISEAAVLEPQIAFYNLFNFANFGTMISTNPLQSAAYPGSVTQGPNTTAGFYDRDSLRTGNGTGVFSQGSARTTEFSVHFDF